MSKDAFSSLPNNVAALQTLLLAEREESHRRVDSLESQLATKDAELQLKDEALAAGQRKLEKVENYIRYLLQRYQSRRERFDPRQLTLFDADELTQLLEEAEQEEQEQKPSRRCKRKGHGRRKLPDHLPREVIRHELPAEERSCPCCGEQRSEIGCETSEQLEFIPAQLKVLRHERVKYACRQCQEQVATAAVPGKPIEKGLPGPGLLAQVVLSKYGDHSPLYRQEDILSRNGVVLRRSTLCGWIAAAAELLGPLHRLMAGRVLRSQVIHTDDTPVKLLDPEHDRALTARFWAYLGDARNPYVAYDFTDSRRRDGPQQFLAGFEGYLQADAYGGYDGIYLNGRVKEVACWTHARRKWIEAQSTDPSRAHRALALIGRLYRIERDGAELDASQRRELRCAESLPILKEFRSWLDAEAETLLPKSPSGRAARYALNQWNALVRYCEEGELSIDNNAAERMMKPCAIGRKNWLFVASREGGRRAAVLMSLVNSCQHNQVEPWSYLRDLFAELPNLGASPSESALEPFLPDRWLETHPAHRWVIDALRTSPTE